MILISAYYHRKQYTKRKIGIKNLTYVCFSKIRFLWGYSCEYKTMKEEDWNPMGSNVLFLTEKLNLSRNGTRPAA